MLNILRFFLAQKKTAFAVDPGNIPQHIAVIMDGNGRWAQRRGLPRIAGHQRGGEALRRTLKSCAELGVKYLTVYAFSTENWERPQEEVDFLMALFSQTIDKEIDELVKNEVRLRFLGRLDALEPGLQEKIRAAEKKTENGRRINLNVMVNYGGRAEIVDACQKLKETNVPISEDAISSALYTAGMPDPDLLIRTGGDSRISNYLLWQMAYAEIYVTPIFWPEFNRERLREAIADFQGRKRRFGRV